MGVLKKIIRCLDNLEDMAVLFLCLILCLVGAYALYDSYLVYQDANDTSILKSKPGYGNDEQGEQKIQGNMVAWLTIDDTLIDYPIMQGTDNTEYLNKNPYGEYSLSGSIFLDSRNAEDFSDEYSLVYGHHMEYGLMFGALDKFLEKDYFDEHRQGELMVGDNTYKIKIFAVVETEATNDKIFAPTVVPAKDTLSYIREKAVLLDESTLECGYDAILGMSTCKYPDTADRTVVFGTLTLLPAES